MRESVTTAVLETIGSAGFIVSIGADDVTAINEKTGERFIVRFHAYHFYDAVVKLAQQVGIDLEDG